MIPIARGGAYRELLVSCFNSEDNNRIGDVFYEVEGVKLLATEEDES